MIGRIEIRADAGDNVDFGKQQFALALIPGARGFVGEKGGDPWRRDTRVHPQVVRDGVGEVNDVPRRFSVGQGSVPPVLSISMVCVARDRQWLEPTEFPGTTGQTAH